MLWNPDAKKPALGGLGGEGRGSGLYVIPKHILRDAKSKQSDECKTEGNLAEDHADCDGDQADCNSTEGERLSETGHFEPLTLLAPGFPGAG